VEYPGYIGSPFGEVLVGLFDLFDRFKFMNICVDACDSHFFYDHRIVVGRVHHDQWPAESLFEFGDGHVQILRIAFLEGTGDDHVKNGIGVCFCGKSRKDIFGVPDRCGRVDGPEYFLEGKWDERQIVDHEDPVQGCGRLVECRGHGFRRYNVIRLTGCQDP